MTHVQYTEHAWSHYDKYGYSIKNYYQAANWFIINHKLFISENYQLSAAWIRFPLALASHFFSKVLLLDIKIKKIQIVIMTRVSKWSDMFLLFTAVYSTASIFRLKFSSNKITLIIYQVKLEEKLGEFKDQPPFLQTLQSFVHQILICGITVAESGQFCPSVYTGVALRQ